MPDAAYDYAVLRIVPRIDRAEFVNTGVILYCPARRFLDCRHRIDPDRLRALAPGLDPALAERHHQAFARICRGDPEGAPIAALPQGERFHWLVHPRSAAFQTSPVHAGCTDDPSQTLDHLFASLVLL